MAVFDDPRRVRKFKPKWTAIMARRITKSALWSVMKKVSLLLVVLSLGTFVFAGTARQDADNRLENSAQVMHEIMNAPDKGIPQEVLEHAKCVAVVPNMLKGGFVLGGSHGKGVATCRTENGWSAPAFFTVGGG